MILYEQEEVKTWPQTKESKILIAIFRLDDDMIRRYHRWDTANKLLYPDLRVVGEG